MANTIPSALITAMYLAMDQVSREMVGFIPAVTLDPAAARAALDQSVYSGVAPAATATDITPAATSPDDGDQTLGSVSITITKGRRVPFRWNGEQTQAVNNGPGAQTIKQNQIAQALRTLTNEIEIDLGLLYKKASRAYGTAGTTPFGTAGDFTDAAQARKILADNGSPMSDLQLVVNTAAGAVFRGKQSQVQISGDPNFQRNGILIDIHGFQIRESAGVVSHTKGTGASYAVNNASGYAVGSTTIAVDTGTGTIVAGDVLTNSQAGRDGNKYVVGTALSAGSLALNAPGNRVAWVDDDTVAVGNSYAANLAFSRSAIVLATRAPALPEEGDIAVDRMLITDPLSGLTFELSMYPQYRQMQYELAIVWGTACIKPEHTAILLG
jgi:hypothetical protein